MTGDDALENVAFARAHSTDEQFELLKSGAAMLCDSRFSLLIVDRCDEAHLQPLSEDLNTTTEV